jgi:serine/threonine protein kinase
MGLEGMIPRPLGSGKPGEQSVVSTPASPKGSARIDPLIDTLIAGKYKIIKKIGEGGMGSVYIADQEPINRKVAIKVLLGKLAEDEVAVKRFEQEARAISKMQHPNTVTIYDFGTEEGRLYIVMEFLKGKTLTQVLRQDGVLVAPRACKIMRQVCSSLADAHAAGIIHRDLKPDNIFLTEVGGDPDWVKVLDFGVAKLADTEGAGTLTQTGMIFGTPKYMSPEQAEGRPIDYRADIYALGVVLFELLVGRPPFISDTPVGLLLKHISEPPAPFKKIRPDLQIDSRVEAIVMKALEKNPDRRQQVVSELANELAAFERAVTGAVPMHAVSTVPGPPVLGGFPTEVIPGTQQGSPVTPAGLMPPNHLPPGLSLSVPSQTRDMNLPSPSGLATAAQGYPPGSTGIATAQNTAQATAQGVMPFAVNTAPIAGTNMLTHPIPAPGGGVDTLGGGLGGEISHGLRPPEKPKTMLLFGGVGALVVAVALAAIALRGGNTVESVPIESPSPAKRETAVEPKNTVVEQKVTDKIEVPPKDPEPPKNEVDTAKNVGRHPKRNEKATKVERTEARSTSANVNVRVESTPSGARVEVDGKQLGVTPFTTTLPRGDMFTLVFVKDGYQSTQKIVATNGDRAVQAELPKAGAGEVKAETPKTGTSKRIETKRAEKTEKVDDLKDKVDDLK